MSHIDRNNDGFHIVLPSNVKDSSESNTPSRYHTQLANSINLIGGRGDNWEVGLVEMSFVNAIKTIDSNEMIHICEKELEEKTKTITSKYDFKDKIGLQNTQLPHSNVLTMDPNKGGIGEFVKHDDFVLTFNTKTANFTLEITNKKIISLDMSPYTAYVLGFHNSAVLDETEHERFYNPVTDGNCNYTIRNKATGRRARVQTAWEKNKFEKYVDILYLNPPNQSSIFEFNIKYKTVGEKLIIKDIMALTVPEGYYQTPQRLVDNLNTTLAERKQTAITLTFDENINRIIYKCSSKSTLIKLDKSVANVLGFSQDQILDKSIVTAKNPPDLRRGIYSLFVYCDLCVETYVGNTLVPLLRNVSYNASGGYGQTITVLYDNPIYVPLNKHTIDRIEMMICDDAGDIVPFIEGKTIATLHFRQRNS